MTVAPSPIPPSPTAAPLGPRIGGGFLIAALAASILHEFAGGDALGVAAGLCSAAACTAFFPAIPWTRRAFPLIALALALIAVLTRGDWAGILSAALIKAGFIGGFFTAMTSLRAAAIGSAPILACGRFLARQPPGRRYLALTAGGHLFGLILSYGAIALLGALSTEAAGKEPNAEIRRHRTRRMLIAIQRGFISTLPWSPLAFATAITMTVVPGATWAHALPYTAGAAILLAGIGWALDTIFKPKLSAPPPPRSAPEGAWLRNLRPLLMLLGLLPLLIAALHLATGVRVIGAVMVAAPSIALVWIVLQEAPGTARLAGAARHAADFARRDLPEQRREIVLLVMAAVIGAIGGRLAAPYAEAMGLDFHAWPAWAALMGLFWLIPLTGQLGMNPILSVSLIAPMLPDPAAIGVSPALMAATITAGWALSGATSPFTATTLLIGSFGGVGAREVGLSWNGVYTLICGAVFCMLIAICTALGF